MDFSILFVKSDWLETPPWIEEIFGDGSLNAQSEQFVQKHISRWMNI